jgi:hypothetical protein
VDAVRPRLDFASVASTFDAARFGRRDTPGSGWITEQGTLDLSFDVWEEHLAEVRCASNRGEARRLEPAAGSSGERTVISASLALQEGDNELRFWATDEAGNRSEEQEVRVRRAAHPAIESPERELAPNAKQVVIEGRGDSSLRGLELVSAQGLARDSRGVDDIGSDGSFALALALADGRLRFSADLVPIYEGGLRGSPSRVEFTRRSPVVPPGCEPCEDSSIDESGRATIIRQLASGLEFVLVSSESLATPLSEGSKDRASFYLGRFELRWREFERVEKKRREAQSEFAEKSGWARDRLAELDDCPVVGISIDEAEEYCGRYGLRLPSREEWDRGAERATDGSSGVSDGALAHDSGKLRAAGSVAADISRFGAFDMAGNAAEWCRPEGSARIKWVGMQGAGGITARPLELQSITRRQDIGFRVVLDPPE